MDSDLMEVNRRRCDLVRDFNTGMLIMSRQPCRPYLSEGLWVMYKRETVL